MPETETRETLHEPIILRPTPLEATLDTQLRKHFGAPLLIGSIDASHTYRRPSVLVPVENTLVGFELSRFDVGTRYSHTLADAYERVSDADTRPLDQHEVIDIIRRQIIERRGKFDPAFALTVPDYYLPEAPIQRWPEGIMFVIFHEAEMQPNIFGSVRIAPHFAGLHNLYTYPDDNRLRIFERIPPHHHLHKAYARSLAPTTPPEELVPELISFVEGYASAT